MKKLIGTVAVAALLASAAFAEISFGAWLRTVVVPVAGDGDTALAGWQNSWGQGVRTGRVNISWTSDDEKVGMLYDIYGDNFKFAAGDYIAGWWKPADWVKFMVGKIDNGYTMRSDVTYGSWNWIRPYTWVQNDEGITFELGGTTGLQIELFPVDGLQILARLPLPVKYTLKEDVAVTSINPKKDDEFDIDEVFKTDAKTYNDAYKQYGNGTVAVGYTIGDIGTIKAAFLGAYDESGAKKKYGTVNAAFDLVAVDNMFLTVGVRIPVNEETADDGTVVLPSLGFSYQITDNFKIALTAAADIMKSNDPKISAGIGIGVGLTDSLSLDADFRYLGDFEAEETALSFLVGVNYNLSSNGYIGIGFQGTTNGNGLGFDAAKADAFCWAVPVAFSLWF